MQKGILLSMAMQCRNSTMVSHPMTLHGQPSRLY